jgi:HSP20 family protein
MASLQIYDPFADPAMDALFRQFFRGERGGDRQAPQAIRVDVAESDKGYVVYAELPGVAKDAIHVAIEGNQVTIAAEVKPLVEAAEGTRVLRTERYTGNLYRSFTLPVELDDQGSEAKYENGVLELRLVKKPAVAGRKLQIQ